MPFFKWKAYDLDIKYTSEAEYKYHEGVMESSRMEMVVLELARRSLVASEIEVTDYDTYRKWRMINARIDRFSRTKPNPQITECDAERTYPHYLGVVIAIATTIVFLLGLLLFRH